MSWKWKDNWIFFSCLLESNGIGGYSKESSVNEGDGGEIFGVRVRRGVGRSVSRSRSCGSGSRGGVGSGSRVGRGGWCGGIGGVGRRRGVRINLID